MRQSAEQSEPRRIAETEVIAAMAAFNVAISSPVSQQISEYHQLLLHWNRKISLTTVAEEEILSRHFGESLFGAKAAGIDSGRLLDVGSGAGFPGLAIAVVHPAIRALLLEPNGKKAAFLAEVVRKLELADRVRISRNRLEDYRADESRFDFITSRAVRVERTFLENCRNLLAAGGKLVPWLSEEDFRELREIGGWNWADPTRIPGSERRLVVWGRPAEEAGVSRETEA